MSAELVIAGYVRIAKQDLDGARLLNTGGNRNAAYLCEQAAEKLIRAVLTSEGIQAGIRHELPDMVSTIPDENPVKPLLRAIQDLDVYATAYRYPSPKGRVKNPPAPADVDQYIAKIELALTQLAARFTVDLSKIDGPAGNVGPIR
jgi:HEPN domain-containing protein